MRGICIAFMGASGTGKTTLARWCEQTFELEMNPIGSRSVARGMGLESPYDVDKLGRRKEFQEKLQAKKMKWEQDNLHEYGREGFVKGFVTDRTTLDELAYTIMHAHEAVTEGYLENALVHMKRYTHVFFCPISAFHDVGDDPTRKKDPTYHRVFEMVLEGLIENAAYPGSFVRLSDGDLEGRKQAIMTMTERARREMACTCGAMR